MTDAAIMTEDSQHIGVLRFHTFPYGHIAEERQGTIYTYAPDGSIVLDEEAITEYITVQDTITWRDGRQFPDEVALVESYPGNYFEIGKRVNETWIAAGIIMELSCLSEDLADEDNQELRYQIKWGKAFSSLPACTVVLSVSEIEDHV